MPEAQAPAAPAQGTKIAPNAAPEVKTTARVLPGQQASAQQVQKVPQTEAQASPQEIEVKVNGQMKKFSLEEAKRLLSKSSHAGDMIRQATEAIRAVKAREAALAEELEMAKRDPGSLLKARGIDPDEFARMVLAKKLDEAQLTPEERRIAELEAKQAEYEDTIKKRDEEKNQARISAAAKQRQTQMENDLVLAADKVGLPRDSDSFFAIYEVVKEFYELGLPWDPERICQVASENIDGGFQKLEQAVLKGLKGKSLVERLGPAVVNEVLRYKVEEHRSGGFRKPEPRVNGTPLSGSNQGEKKYLSVDEGRKQIKALGAMGKAGK